MRHCSPGATASDQPSRGSCQIPQPANGKVSRKRTADRNQADSAQPTRIESSIGSVRREILKLELKRPPPRISSEALPVGLPRPGQTLGTQVNIVLLVVAEDVKFNPMPSAGINGFAVNCEIECDLNKTAISSRLTSPRIRIAGRPATISRTMVPLDTPPMTQSVNSCHLVPIADSGGSRLRSSIMVESTFMVSPCTALPTIETEAASRQNFRRS